MTVFKDKNGVEINVGDIVENTAYDGKGKGSGIVAFINQLHPRPHPIGVDFGKRFANTHSLGRRISDSTGYWFPPGRITVVSQKEILGDNDEDCI